MNIEFSDKSLIKGAYC